MIKSLIKSSENKQESQEILPLNSTTTSSKISLMYDSLRELLEALALKKGFKVYNHECYAAFIKEILNESGLGDKFDDLRKVRNSANYYGKEITIEECVEIIKRIRDVKDKLLKLFPHELG